MKTKLTIIASITFQSCSRRAKPPRRYREVIHVYSSTFCARVREFQSMKMVMTMMLVDDETNTAICNRAISSGKRMRTISRHLNRCWR